MNLHRDEISGTLENKKIAIVGFDDPLFGRMNGGKRCILNSALALLEAGASVSLIGFHNRSEMINDKVAYRLRGVQHFSIINQSNILLFFSKYPVCVGRRYRAALKKIPWSSFDFVLFEGEQVYKVFAKFHPFLQGFCVRLHDIESEYRNELKKSQHGISSILNGIESLRFSKLERAISDGRYPLLFVSKDEMDIFRQRLSRERVCYFAPPIQNPRRGPSIAQSPNHEYALLFGDFTLPNNRSSILWFFRSVIPNLKKLKPDFSIHICGAIEDDVAAEIVELFPSCSILGYVENLQEEIDGAKFILCPILFGAGIKVKLIEAVGNEKLVICNKKAVEGSGFEHNKHLWVADNVEEYSQLVEKAIWSDALPNFSKDIRDLLESEFSDARFCDIVSEMLFNAKPINK